MPNISGYTLTFNCESQNFPWRESIQSHLDFCNEVVVIDDNSSDGTYESLVEWSAKEPKLKVHSAQKTEDERLKIYSGSHLKTLGRKISTGDFLWQFDVDEIVHENDYQKIHNLCDALPQDMNLVALPVLEYWGPKGKCRIDVNTWKWRISRNNPDIIHGIPKDQRAYDEKGNMYSKGSDGDDYIYESSLERVPWAMTWTPEFENLRHAALHYKTRDISDKFGELMIMYIDHYPGVYHYSWWSIRRKVVSYRDYWRKHWPSIFNTDPNDTPENNVFFDKPWAEVNENDIDEVAIKLEKEMGGWICHRKVNFSTPTPWFYCDKHPKIMKTWRKKNNI